ncbi:PilZ domain-containing protein [Roseibium salinum]|nr:PilZ domain-containing protein [Roseibium salinum]
MPDTKPVAEQRQTADDAAPAQRARRARVFKKGKMVFQDGLRSIPCLVRNISDGGALLEFEQAYMLPKEFDLHIDLEDYEVTCERRWEDGLRCGVAFVGEKAPDRQRARASAAKLRRTPAERPPNERMEAPDAFLARIRPEKRPTSQ